MTEAPIGSPEWWVETLVARLVARRKVIKTYADYYEGDHNLQFASARWEQAFGNLLQGVRDNWCELVVDAVNERLTPTGFRWGDDSEADKDAWEIWQQNHLDAEAHLAHTEALINGEAAALVDPFMVDGGFPEITVEHPSQVIVAYDQGSRWKRLAALKMWTDDYDETFATLYLPNEIYKYKQMRRGDPPGIIIPNRVKIPTWAPREVTNNGVKEDWPLRHGLGIVPMVPLVNRPRMLKAGVSEIKNVIPNQDAVNKLVADLIIASEFGSFRQRYAMGLELEEDEYGNLKLPFEVGADRMLVNENEAGRFGEFSATDLTNIVAAIQNRVQSIASQTRTPPHYFYLKGEFPSGEAIKSAETGLVAKTRDKMTFFGEGWEEVMRLAFRVKDPQDQRGQDPSAETIWADPESRSESETVDAAVKLKAIGVANEVLQERIGMTPKERERNAKALAKEALDVQQAFALSEPGSIAPQPDPQPVE